MQSKDNVLVQEVKREVLAELQEGRPVGVDYLNYPPPGVSTSWDGYNTYNSRPMYQTIKDSVKSQVLSDIEMQQADQRARAYGLDHSLSDRRLHQMIDARYRTIDKMKAEIKKELQAIQRMDKRRTNDPYIRQIAGGLVEEARS